MSKRVFLHEWDPKRNPAPFELLRWHFAELYGWTLPQVDALTMGDLEEWVQIQDGRSKARAVNGSK